MPDLEAVTEEYAPGVSAEDIEEMAKKLMQKL